MIWKRLKWKDGDWDEEKYNKTKASYLKRGSTLRMKADWGESEDEEYQLENDL